MKSIPNLITCLNLFAGCLACVMALNGNYIGAFFFIVLASVFDFLDGFAARLLNAYSKLGAELDSLADVISFGLAPGCIIYAFLLQSTESLSITSNVAFLAFLLPMFTALRLAKFNIDTRQTTSFLGLPVPASGLFWSSFIPSIIPYLSGNEYLLTIIVVCLLIAFCLLMVSELPMFSLKFKNYSWKGNEWSYTLVILAILLVCVFKVAGVSLTILAYILLSVIKTVGSKKQLD